MKAVNLKIFGTMFLLSFSFPIESLFAKDPVNPDPFPDSPALYNAMQIESISPVTYDILGSNLAVCFNSPIGTATVTIENQTGNVVYQSVVNTDTQSVLYVPIENWKTGNYTISVASESIDFVSGFHL
ncbi:MAG: DUF3244 domain-containing protein [Paludibacter sp.]